MIKLTDAKWFHFLLCLRSNGTIFISLFKKIKSERKFNSNRVHWRFTVFLSHSVPCTNRKNIVPPRRKMNLQVFCLCDAIISYTNVRKALVPSCEAGAESSTYSSVIGQLLYSVNFIGWRYAILRIFLNQWVTPAACQLPLFFSFF